MIVRNKRVMHVLLTVRRRVLLVASCRSVVGTGGIAPSVSSNGMSLILDKQP
jgi:hypothetical protein